MLDPWGGGLGRKGLVSGASRVKLGLQALWPFSGGGGGQVATEQIGSDGRAGNHRGEPRGQPPVEIREDILEEANCLQGTAGLVDSGRRGRTCLVRRIRAVVRVPVLSLPLSLSFARVGAAEGGGWV